MKSHTLFNIPSAGRRRLPRRTMARDQSRSADDCIPVLIILRYQLKTLARKSKEQASDRDAWIPCTCSVARWWLAPKHIRWYKHRAGSPDIRVDERGFRAQGPSPLLHDLGACDAHNGTTFTTESEMNTDVVQAPKERVRLATAGSQPVVASD